MTFSVNKVVTVTNRVATTFRLDNQSNTLFINLIDVDHKMSLEAAS